MTRRRFVSVAVAMAVALSGIPAAADPADDQSSAELHEAGRLLAAGQLRAARDLLERMAAADEGGTEREFLDGMISYAGKDYRRAESAFRRILDRDRGLLRVRLELARTLYMEREDEQADYQFGLAAGENPSAPVMRNILRFREAIRARRSWRFNVDFGFAPDSNINSATDKETVDIDGLPFRLDPSGRAHSGTGRFVGADASVRLNRSAPVTLYVAADGRWVSYRDHRFGDRYLAAQAGPEFRLGGGQLRTTATALGRWYGKRPLVSSFGARLDYEKVVGGKWTLGGALLVRHNDYARRADVDGWDAEARVSGTRPLGPTSLAFGYAGIERNWAIDRGQAFWRAKMGIGVLEEIGWGMRPQLAVDVARQVGDSPLAPFAKLRRDWLLQGTASIYKRDWNLRGFAPSLSVTFVRNVSTVSLYQEKRLRAEIRLTKAF